MSKQIWRVMRFTGSAWLPFWTGLIGLIISRTTMTVIYAKLIQDLLDALSYGDASLFWPTLLQACVFILVVIAFTPVARYLFASACTQITGTIRKTLFDKIHRLSLTQVRSQHSGDLLSRLTNDVSAIEPAYGELFQSYIVSMAAGLAGAIYLLHLSFWLFLFALGSGLLMTCFYIPFVRRLRTMTVDVIARLGKLTERLSDILAGALTIRSYNLQSRVLGQLDQENQELQRIAVRRIGVNASFNAFSLFFSMAIIKVAFGAYLAIIGVITPGAIWAALILHTQTEILFRATGNYLARIQGPLAAAARVFELLDLKDEIVDDTRPSTASTAANAAVEMMDVEFAYTDARQAIKGLSLQVTPGQTIALVGPSGGGKSTVFKLLMGLYRPQAGHIFVQGVEVRPSSLEQTRNLIAYVPQEATLFSGTIAENIQYGCPGASQEEIVQAARDANAHGFICELPQAYDTPVGERGTKLSGGQRQRIAIARALLRNAPILLLDEATSALDTESELLVQQALQRLMQGRTTLVIAHRLSTIREADEILVVKEGTIVERGTHDELVRHPAGVYRDLYLRQFMGMGDEVAGTNIAI